MPADRPAMDLHDRWMRTTEVAAELGVSAETVRRLIRAQRLRATAIVANGRTTLRVRRSDFRAFCRTHVKDTIEDDWE